MSLSLKLQGSGALPTGSDRVAMSDGAITIGRGAENDLALPDPTRQVSKRHCVIEARDGGFVLVDVSTNGTFVNYAAERVGETGMPVGHGDVIAIGPYELVVEIAAEMPEAAPDPFAAAHLPPAPDASSFERAPGGGVRASGHGLDDIASVLDGSGDPLGGDGGDDVLDDILGEGTPARPQPGQQPYWRDAGSRADRLADAGPVIPDDDDDDFLKGAADDPFQPGVGATPDHAAGTSTFMAAPPGTPGAGAGETGSGGGGAGGALIPDDWEDDLLAPPSGAATGAGTGTGPAGTPLADPFGGAPATDDPFAAPPATGAPAPGTAAPTPGRAVIPEDDDPFADLLGDAPTGPLADEPAARHDPFATPPGTEAPASPPPAAAPTPPRPAAAPGTAPGPAGRPATERPPQPPAGPAAAPSPAATPTPEATSEAGARAFLEAAGIDPAALSPEEMVETMARSGAVFRTLVEGLRDVLMNRAAIKGEFRMQQTQIRSDGNNPLKFSVTPEQAVEAMIRPKRRGFLDAGDAAREAARDIRAHEVATMTGMEAALKHLLAEVDPAALAGRIETTGGLGGLFGNKKAKLWEAYERTYAKIATDVEDDFQTVFGREFARAYEEQLKKL